MQVGAQASVTHIDVAMVTATVLLVTEVGGAFGGAVGSHFSLVHYHRLLFDILFGFTLHSWRDLVEYDAAESGEVSTVLERCRTGKVIWRYQLCFEDT